MSIKAHVVACKLCELREIELAQCVLRKPSLEEETEEYDIADIQPNSCATVHGMCVSSPQKVSKKDCYICIQTIWYQVA